MKVKVVLFDSLLQTRSLQNIGVLYGLAIVLSSLFVKEQSRFAFHETTVCMIDVTFILLLSLVNRDKHYAMWHVPTILSFIRGQTMQR